MVHLVAVMVRGKAGKRLTTARLQKSALLATHHAIRHSLMQVISVQVMTFIITMHVEARKIKSRIAVIADTQEIIIAMTMMFIGTTLLVGVQGIPAQQTQRKKSRMIANMGAQIMSVTLNPMILIAQVESVVM